MMPNPKMPDFLKPGDLVSLVCPASFVRGELEDAYRLLSEWGLRVHVGKTVHAQYFQYAGSDELRTADLQSVLDDPEIKAVFAARGGYGTVRIIDQINFSSFVQNPKWLIGFSDITVLHSHIHACFGIPTIHGQMPVTIPDATIPSLDTLKRALFGEPISYHFKTSDVLMKYNRNGEANGVLIGGNLALLHSVMCSVSEMDFTNKVLVIEDVGEQYYNIDRMLWTLKRANKLSQLAGLLVGGFTSMKDSPDVPFGSEVPEIVLEKIKDYNYPVAFDFPSGHIPNNHALIFGLPVQLNVVDAQVGMDYL